MLMRTDPSREIDRLTEQLMGSAGTAVASCEVAKPTEDELLDEIAQLHQALQSRDLIGQAKGVIRALHAMDDGTSFALLCHLSQDTNRKVHDVAGVIVECITTAQPLPGDLSLSWKRRTDEAAGVA